MNWIAWRMLIGNRGKYLGIIIGIAFSALLIAQQSSIFCGLMRLTYSQIRDTRGADIWVMDENVQFIDDIKPLSDDDLRRVQGVTGVDWAQRFYKGLGRAKLDDGNYQQIIILGLDNSSLVGAPTEILIGNLADLNMPDAVIMDDAGYQQMWPGEKYATGKTFEMNDHRAIVVGVCRASRTFQTFPVVYTRYSQAIEYAPSERKVLSFILADGEPGVPTNEVCRRIHEQTGLKALSRQQFMDVTEHYFMEKTGIPFNFGIVVALGFIVGAVISGQTFYMFTIENIKQFGALKAMGTSNLRIVRMVLLQAFQVGLIGYGIGVGGAATFGWFIKGASRLAFYMPWQVLALTAVLVVIIILISAVLSIRKVLVIDPAVVFQG
jgi:putative ABC transport system permease protein